MAIIIGQGTTDTRCFCCRRKRSSCLGKDHGEH